MIIPSHYEGMPAGAKMLGGIWRFPKMEVRLNHPFSWDFPRNKPSIWGLPPLMETPIW
jgi:hypothetical protein